MRNADRPDHPERHQVEDREIVPVGSQDVAQRGERAARVRGGAQIAPHGAPLLQHDRHQEEVDHQRHELDEGAMEARVEAEQQGDLGRAVAEDADAQDPPRPQHRVARPVLADRQQPERRALRAHQQAHHGEQDAHRHIGVDEGEDHEPGDRALAEPGAEQPVADAGEDQRGHEIEQEGEAGEASTPQLPGRPPPAAGLSRLRLALLRLAGLAPRLGLVRLGLVLLGPRRRHLAVRPPGEPLEPRPEAGERPDRQPLRRQPRRRDHHEPPGHGEQHLMEVAVPPDARKPDREERERDHRARGAGDRLARRGEAVGEPDQHLRAEAVRLERNRQRGRHRGRSGRLGRRRLRRLRLRRFPARRGRDAGRRGLGGGGALGGGTFRQRPQRRDQGVPRPRVLEHRERRRRLLAGERGRRASRGRDHRLRRRRGQEEQREEKNPGHQGLDHGR